MINVFEEYSADKKILILGFGREGRSTYKYLRKLYPNRKLYVMDSNSINDELDNTEILCDDKYMCNLSEFDIVMKSPGIVLTEVQLSQINVLESQTSLFLKKLRKQIIGITGTKGKSTTTSLIYHLLHSEDENTFIVGNIGIPCFDVLGEINSDSKIVFELSCHQLEFTKVSPSVSILLNFYEEHLDHYGTYENYKNAKRHIYEYQDETDVLYHNVDIADIKSKSRKITIGLENNSADYYVLGRTIYADDEVFEVTTNDTQLLGNHNVYNIAVAYAVCQHYGMSHSTFMNHLKDFKPLQHRLEYVGTKNNIRYYDDSISTACETAISALESIEKVDTILLGGMDRGIDYSSLLAYLSKNYCNNIIFAYDSGKRMYDELKAIVSNDYMNNVYLCEDLKDAVNLAKRITRAEYACVLSPASASYGYFKNFEERGDYFKKYVNED